ncbi:MAG TPA: hypothetical protein VLX90_15110 [Steroidobacteraceae bacterium]|nr:hypothetical protein [Steroidobacteraceae bacterium]
MRSTSRRGRTLLRSAVSVSCLTLLTVMLSGCVALYVDNGVPDTQPSEFHRPQTPQPVQLLFSFQTKGVANARATDILKDQVKETVTASGLFSAVSPDPVAGGAILSVTIDNEPITSQQEAMAKGFGTGLTFGLAGSEVTDGYICTVDYLGAPGSARISKVVHHAIHATVGAHAAPANSTKAPDARTGVKTMARQAVGAALKALSDDPAFGHQAP